MDEAQEFIEIAKDFSNPLDLVREAISNAYDAKATEITISFDVIQELGEYVLRIVIEDNGTGMDSEGLQSFFDLGNSLRRSDPEAIGEKGHGTKVYFNSRRIEVTATNASTTFHAVLNEPFRRLHNHEIPTVEVTSEPSQGRPDGTRIEILGYNNNRRERFTHDILKDHIMWFTKHGAVENCFNPDRHRDTVLSLKGLGRDKPERIPRGHHFPQGSVSIDRLFDEYITKAPDHYCKRIIKEGQLRSFPEIKYQAVFSIEGKHVKYSYNPMIRHSGYRPPKGGYTIQERYGLWLCKDFIPIQRKNEWITHKGSEYTKFHAFFNCQDLKLTANRGSIENTPSEVLQDIEDEVRAIYDDIVKSDEWIEMDWLEEEASSYRTIQKERKNFKWRLKKINRANIATYNGITLVEPERESGVFSIFILLSVAEPGLFPFQIIDYDTHEGIDVIAKGDKATPVASARLFYVEFKRNLASGFNHAFENLHSVVCWNTDIKHDDTVKGINGEERKMQILSPEGDNDHTRYFLDNPRKAHKIEVFVLRYYLKEKLGLEFKPRTKDSVI